MRVRAPLAIVLVAVLLVAACGGGETDDPAAFPDVSLPEIDTESLTSDELPATFPESLVYPDSSFLLTLRQDDPHRLIVLFRTEDGAELVLGFYEEAFAALGLGREGVRNVTETTGAYVVGDQQTGSGVIVERGAADDGSNLITVGYYVP